MRPAASGVAGRSVEPLEPRRLFDALPYDYVISPGQSVASVTPLPGQRVNVLPGTYAPFQFPASGTPGNRIYYHFEPGSVVDANRGPVAVWGGTWLEIDGLVQRNARNNFFQGAAVRIGTGSILRNFLIEYNDATGLDLRGVNPQAINGTLQWNGQQGYSINGTTNALMQNVKVFNNNYGMVDPIWANHAPIDGWTVSLQRNGLWYTTPQWEAGGGKTVETDGTVFDGVESAWNIGGNCNFDIDNRNVIVRNSWFHDAKMLSAGYESVALSFEYAVNAADSGYLAENNRIDIPPIVDAIGLAISSVHGVTVRNNQFNGSGTGISIVFRADDTRGAIYDTTITGNQFNRCRIQRWGSPAVTAVIDGNSYLTGTSPIFDWSGPRLTTLTQVRALGFEATGAFITVAAPTVVGWESVAVHGSLGEFSLAIPDDGSFSEPRVSGIRTLRVRFSAPLSHWTFTPASVLIAGNNSAGQPVDLSGIVASVALSAGNTVATLQLSRALPDYARYRIRLSGLDNPNAILSAGDNDRVMTALLGDATGDLRVNSTDVGGVISVRGITAISAQDVWQIRSDLTQDGRINNTDVGGALSIRGRDARSIADPTAGGSAGTVAAGGAATSIAPVAVTSVRTSTTARGVVFRDDNENGRLDPLETGIGGWLVWLDLNGDKRLNHNEPRAATDRWGRYAITLAKPVGHSTRCG